MERQLKAFDIKKRQTKKKRKLMLNQYRQVINDMAQVLRKLALQLLDEKRLAKRTSHMCTALERSLCNLVNPIGVRLPDQHELREKSKFACKFIQDNVRAYTGSQGKTNGLIYIISGDKTSAGRVIVTYPHGGKKPQVHFPNGKPRSLQVQRANKSRRSLMPLDKLQEFFLDMIISNADLYICAISEDPPPWHVVHVTRGRAALRLHFYKWPKSPVTSPVSQGKHPRSPHQKQK